MPVFAMRSLISSFVLLFAAIPSQSQPVTAHTAEHKSCSYPLTAAKGTVADTAENNYDVHYVKFNLSVTNRSTYIQGDVSTQAQVTAAAGMGTYVFELNNSFTIDSVKINQQLYPVSTNGAVRTVTLPASLANQSLFQAQVFYHGNGTNGGFAGMFSVSDPNYGILTTFTLSEPYDASRWWPCKQALQDKIDSADIWLTVDSNLKAGSNGVLQQVTALGSKRRYEWKNRSSIDYYLLSLAVAPYEEYSYYLHYTGSGDSTLVQNYIYPGTLPAVKSYLDSTASMIRYFSEKFGRYPFWKEKYGHSLVPIGGMENQTMTTLGQQLVSDPYTVAHELAHHWFGDHVTCATWKDVWLNEGLTTYMEYVYAGQFLGPVPARQRLSDIHNHVLTTSGAGSQTVYVNDTINFFILFNPVITYDKGAAVVHMLRFVANDDSLFFRGLHNYLQQYGGKTATTEDFKQVMAATYNRNLDTFFNQWIYRSGWPVFSGGWNQAGNLVFLQLRQTGTGNCPVFSTPLEIKLLSGGQGDTTVKVYFNAATQLYSFVWNKTVQGITIDPDNWLLKQQSLFAPQPGLGINPAATKQDHLSPNPVGNTLTIHHTQACHIRMTNAAGSTVLKQDLSPRNEQTLIDVSRLPAGMYLYVLQDKDGKPLEQGKLVKQ